MYKFETLRGLREISRSCLEQGSVRCVVRGFGSRVWGGGGCFKLEF